MSGIASPGIGSGLDIKGIVANLVKADIYPKQKILEQQAQSTTNALSAMGQIKSGLLKLQGALANLYSLDKVYGIRGSTSDQDHFTVTTTSQALPGQHNIEVTQLAQRHTLASRTFPDISTGIGTGSINIQLGTYSPDNTTFTPNPDVSALNLNIVPGQNSLKSIADTINNTPNTPVKASIIQDSQGARLSLTSTATGEKFAMKIAVTNSDTSNGLSALAFDRSTGTTNMTEASIAKNSIVKINGTELINSSNTLKNVIDGVTLELKKEEPGKITTLTLSQDKAGLTASINDFIKQYNDTMNLLNAQSKHNKDVKIRGALATDSSIRALKAKLGAWTAEPLKDSGSALRTLSDIGITVNQSGLLTLDNSKFEKVLESNYKDIGTLFAKTATSSDTGIVVSSLDKTIKAGNYQVNLTSFNPGVELHGSIGNGLGYSSDGRIMRGTGDLKALNIEVIGGGTGFRGTITVKDGIAQTLDNMLEGYLNSKGEIVNRTRQMENKLKSLEKDEENLALKADKLEKRYFRQYNALDGLLAHMQATSNNLLQQLANFQKN